MPIRHETYHPKDYVAPKGSWASSDPIRRTMLRNRGRDTKPELAIRSEVHRRGMRYRVAVRPLQGVRRSADLVFTKARVAVFIDGCFWHHCPIHFRMPATNREFWEPKLARNVARDRETERFLEEAGWTVLRVWEHETVADAATVIQHVVMKARAGKG